MIRFMSPIIAVLFLVPATYGQPGQPDSAQSILKTSIENARKEKNNVLIIYHATWCEWCSKLDSVLEEPAIKKIFNEHYIIARLDVKERGEKIKIYENPGANETLIKYGGEESGIPFIVFLNGKGKMIANSNVMPKKQNIGYPGSKKEISAFIKLLKKTAPRIKKEQLSFISEFLVKRMPK